MIDDNIQSGLTHFSYDKSRGGVFCDKYKIAPYPGQVMRMHTLNYLIKKYVLSEDKDTNADTKKRYIEVGCGNGAIAYEAYRMGFDVSVFDFNTEIHDLINYVYNSDEQRIKVYTEFPDNEKGSFDCFLASEVLEHIEDAESILKQWGSLLKTGGHIFLTVPAKMKYWSSVDEMAGHVLRYEKDQMEELLNRSGFENADVRIIGYPFHTFTIGLRNVMVYNKRAKQVENLDMEGKTKSSGISKSVEWQYRKIVPYKLINHIAYIQRRGDKYGRGNILVAAARKK